MLQHDLLPTQYFRWALDAIIKHLIYIMSKEQVSDLLVCLLLLHSACGKRWRAELSNSQSCHESFFLQCWKICNLCPQWNPACCHPPVSCFDTPTANILQFISLSDFWTDRSRLDVQTDHLFPLWHLCIDSSTHAAHWQTDLYMRDTRYPLNEYGWSCPSVHLPPSFTSTEC